MRTLIVKSVKVILVLIVVYFVGRQLSGNWDAVRLHDWTINWWLLALSIISHLVTFVLFSQVWRFLISGMGQNVPLRYAFKLAYMVNLGRYIPGKVWHVIGMAYLARQIRIKEEVAVASWGLAMLFALPSAFMAGLFCMLFLPELRQMSQFMGVGFMVTIGITIALSIGLIVAPNRSLGLFNRLLRLFKRSEVHFQLKTSVAIMVYVGYFCCWLAYGFSFWLFILSVAGDVDLPVLAGVGTFVIAYQIGYLAVFSPAGIGVRELILTTLLTPYLGPVATGLAVASRLWNLVAEIVAALIAWRIRFREQKTEDFNSLDD
ncbi:MAG: YbhN family protein [Candidatus Zixiibacteriota bacterium]